MTRMLKKKVHDSGDYRGDLRVMEQVMLFDISDETACRPPSDVHETPEEVVIRMELPGVPQDCVEVLVRGARIEVCGEKRPDTAADASYLCMERSFGRFNRTFDVNGPVNLFRMTVVLKGGVLALHLPKVLERRGRERKIPIRTEEEEN